MTIKNYKLAIFLTSICCFLISFPSSKNNVHNDVTQVNATTNYGDYNYDAKKDGTKLPNELHYIKSGEVDKTTGDVKDDIPVIEDGRLKLTDGGNSSFDASSSRPYGRRLIYFTLYEDVIGEFSLYTTGSSKKFIIYYDNANQFEYTLTKNISNVVSFQFKNIPSSGKLIKIGAGSSSVYLENLTLGVNKRSWFDANGGTFDDGSSRVAVEVKNNESDVVSPPNNPKRDNYIFVGWSESSNDSTVVTSYTYGKTYYAVWEPISGVNLYLSDMVLYLDINSSKKLTAHILPSKYSNLEITWKSENDSIVSVDGDGLVTAKNYGSTNVVASCEGASAKCEVIVMKECTVNFYQSYEKYVNGEIYSTRKVFENEGISYFPTFGSGKGYEVVWKADVKGTKDNKNDDIEFNPSSNITSDLNIYAEAKILPVATVITLSIKESEDIINTTDNLEKPSYYVKKLNSDISLDFVLDRDDGRFDEVKNDSKFKETQNDITYYSMNEEIATIDSKTGKFKLLKAGKVELYARMYENTKGYKANEITSSSIVISSLGEKVVDGKTIDTNVYLEKPQLGRFQDANGTIKAVRFIGYIKDEFFPFINNARFKVQAITNSNVVQKEFTYDVESFSKTINFVSKTPFTKSDFKSWSKPGYYGTSFTITNLPDQEFIGYFKVKFMVMEIETEIIVPSVATINYRGVV